MEELNLIVGGRVRERRIDLNYSQEKLAEQIGKSTGFIGQLERGETSLKLSTLKVLADKLSLDLNALLDTDPEKDDSDLFRLNDIYNKLNKSNKELVLGIAEYFLNYQNKEQP